MLKRCLSIVFGLGMILVVAGCGSAPPAGSTSSAPTATRAVVPAPTAAPTLPAASGVPSPTSAPRPTASATEAPRPAAATATTSGLERAVANAQADLARRLGVAPASASVVQSESVTWPDGSLGCPQPGVMYTQIVTPGYHVVLSAGGQEYDYRGTQNAQMRLCERPKQAATPEAPPTVPSRGEIAVPTTSSSGQGSAPANGPWAKEIAAAQADLLKRQPSFKAGDISVQSAEAVTWNDGSLGCAQPGMMYTMALVPGYRIVLEAGGATYSYHGAQGQPPRLCQTPRLPGGAPTDATK